MPCGPRCDPFWAQPLRVFVQASHRYRRGEARVTIAALFVETNGCYSGLSDVELWDVARDARLYNGPHPVVAHPPCSRWCRLAGLVEARWGHKRGEDGGCFAAALAAVRKWGGVLEHPAYSDAWAAFGLTPPPRHGGWARDLCGGWSAHVEQGRYGHPAKKATWLYAYGCDLPSLRWGFNPYQRSSALVSWCGNHTRADEKRPRVGKRAAAATPLEFRDLLLGIARTAIADRNGNRQDAEERLGPQDESGGAEGNRPRKVA